MLRRLKASLKKLLNKATPPVYVSGPETIVKNTRVEIRNGAKDPQRCVFGSDSVISGNFVLETDNAEISVGDRTFLGGGLYVSAEKIEIGSDVLVSWGCTFIDTNAHPVNWKERASDVKDWHRGLKEGAIGFYKDWSNVVSKPIKICDRAWIGFDCKILKGVTIGEGAIVGAGSVVLKDVPPYTVVAGNPAQVVKELSNEDMA